jgi:hypothetical protein
MPFPRLHVLALALTVGLYTTSRAIRADEPLQFNRDIRPILSDFCFKCHGFDANHRKGGLKLHVPEGATAQLKSHHVAITPGDLEHSEMWRRITTSDDDERMPPRETGKRLSASQIAKLKQWIIEGAQYEPHWAFITPRKSPLPSVADNQWPRTPIDCFVLARLEREKIVPAAQADRATLIRRLYLDLLGLPPSPEAVSDFVARGDYEQLVDRLLESPHFGERWGRYWLDAARYADSDGYNGEKDRPYAWRYRKWVIDAVNADMGFDEFTVEQLAGDLVPAANLSTQLAAGFHRNTLTNRETGTDPEENRVGRMIDRTNTTAATWLGLTVSCAQCHDHKYDPITQREYYQLYAFFNNTEELDAKAPLPGDPKAIVMTLAHATKPRDTFVHVRGDFLRHGSKVEPDGFGFLPPIHDASSGGRTRLDLARWLVSPDHPLTARVQVNRIWQSLFGAGIVATDDDFGMQGDPPSHPELLDWLAVEFMEHGWSRKHVIRLIVNSATYRQSSAARPDLQSRDPLNRLLAHQSRYRLDAELIRDQALAAAGLLSEDVAGRSFRPPVPEGAGDVVETQWSVKPTLDRFRRGMYIHVQRTVPYPMLVTFDAPDGNVTCTRRMRSNTPLQALTMLNDPTFVEAARAFGQRIWSEADGVDERITRGVVIGWGRPPESHERRRLTDLFEEQRSLYARSPQLARDAVAGLKLPPGLDAVEAAAWIGVARTIMNTDAFITRE